MRVLGVSAVADGDERHDASPDIGAAAPERPGVAKPALPTIKAIGTLRRS